MEEEIGSKVGSMTWMWVVKSAKESILIAASATARRARTPWKSIDSCGLSKKHKKASWPSKREENDAEPLDGEEVRDWIHNEGEEEKGRTLNQQLSGVKQNPKKKELKKLVCGGNMSSK